MRKHDISQIKIKKNNKADDNNDEDNNYDDGTPQSPHLITISRNKPIHWHLRKQNPRYLKIVNGNQHVKKHPNMWGI